VRNRLLFVHQSSIDVIRHAPTSSRLVFAACNVRRRGQHTRDVGVSVGLNAKAFTPCRTPAVAAVRSHPPWGEHRQPDPTAAIGASSRSGIPRIRSCDAVWGSNRRFGGSVPLF
jgi:hypothetical protein